ncbi:polysaccharide pyruvyl transferase family protein [Pontiellaceae bacterium B1224]|nr:polysaccharide pyruvyl transferase family protein [Pontiellaceae bacterium B1224]
MKIGILYTLSEFRPVSYNPGDDIVRDGQRYLFEKASNEDIEWVIFNYNQPAEWFEQYQWLRKLKKPKWVLPIWSFIPLRSCRLLACDYLINAAGPRLAMGKRLHCFFWPAEQILARIFKKYKKPQYMSFAFGSIFKFARRPDSFWMKKLNIWFCGRHVGRAAVVTCREQVAAGWVEQSGIPTEVLVCPSILARRYHRLEIPELPSYVLLNFHTASNREYLDQAEHDPRWMEVLKNLVAYFEGNSIPIKFVFHEEMELELARKYYPVEFESRYILPKDIPEYLEAYGHASVAITGRIHGAYAAASFGVPSICIAGDTRLNMIKLLELPTFFCKTCTAEEIIRKYEAVLSKRERHKQRLLQLAEQAESRYLELLKENL